MKPVSRAKDVLDVLLVSPIHVLIGNSATMAVMRVFPASKYIFVFFLQIFFDAKSKILIFGTKFLRCERSFFSILSFYVLVAYIIFAYF